ncbi:hypothetical protein DSM104299_03209 [Baekduia alba]|nr:hypothetical protein DSM104299_03209 [Baekduia alba]
MPEIYRPGSCPNCGRHRVHGAAMLDEDGVCEKCGWDVDGGDYASVTRSEPAPALDDQPAPSPDHKNPSHNQEADRG